MCNNPTHLRTVFDQDGAVILDIKLGKISKLNRTGSFVWRALEQGETPEAIAIRLASETGEEVSVVGRDVHQLITALAAQHLCPADMEKDK
jgi:hypothetical protein